MRQKTRTQLSKGDASPALPPRRRARSDEDKAAVKALLIATGHRLFSTMNAADVSLRKLAAEAGYSPAVVYRHFADRRELFAAVRGHDMAVAADTLEIAIRGIKDPARRVVALFDASVDYWLAHLDHFDVLFQMSPLPDASRKPFGRSEVVERILSLYYGTVEDWLASLPSRPIAARLAADTLLAAVYGSIAFPRMTRTMQWSDMRQMTRGLVRTLVRQWAAQAAAKLSG